MNEIGRIEECIEILERHLEYEQRKGTHTFTMCPCGRQGRRRYKCTKCLKEELEKYKQQLSKENQK
jgi:hypothetical protein